MSTALAQSHGRWRSLTSTAVVAAVLAVASAVVASAGSPAGGTAIYGSGSSASVASPHVASPSTTSSFSIAGGITRLFPGVARHMTLTISNHLRVTITVTSISTSVATSSMSCAAANVRVTSYSGHLKIAARKSSHVTVTVSMYHGAKNVCEGVRFPFTYHGRGTHA